MAHLLQKGLTRIKCLLQKGVIMLQKLKNVDWVYFMLLLLGLRAVVEASFAQALIVVCFAGLRAYSEYLKTKEIKDLNAEVKKELQDMKLVISGISMKGAVKTSSTADSTPRRFF